MAIIAGEGCKPINILNKRKPLKEIERNIIKKYRKDIWSKFTKGLKEYDLVQEGDRIAVGISGGKDSLLMAKLFQELKAHSNKVNFELEFIVADPGYHPDIKKLLIDNCKYLNIPIKIFDSGIFTIVDALASGYPCFMCAKMR